MHDNILKELYQPFNLKARSGVGGKTFKYAATNDIVDRMNKVFKGEWSTELISSEIVDNQILILVRVSVKDDKGHVHFHDGYASQQIMKYTSGINTGKIIDLGNLYRSAMSKAIKTAVARWGVGLYLEGEESSSDSVQSDMTFLPNTGTVSYNPPPVNAPENSHIPPNSPPINTPPVTGPVAEPVVNTPPVVNTFDGPPVGGPPINTSVEQPVFTSVNPEPIPDMVPPVVNIPQANNRENLTDVQKVAIETIMSVHSLTFPGLAAKALERLDNLPQSLDVVSYSDAVKMIQFGNNLRPGQSS